MMGFDDERGRDAWVEEEVERALWLVVWAPAEGERGREWVEVFRAAVMEAIRPALDSLVELARRLGDALADVARRLGDLADLVEELAREGGGSRGGRARGPEHRNCGCYLPVEWVDPVRAGRTRWWTRK